MPRAAPKLCPSGHRQTTHWRFGDDCWQCDKAARAALISREATEAYRREQLALLGPIPRTMELREASTGRLVAVFTTGSRRRRRR